MMPEPRTVLRFLAEPIILALRIFTLPFKLFGLMLGIAGASLLFQDQHAADGACGLIVAAMLLGIRSWVLRL